MRRISVDVHALAPVPEVGPEADLIAQPVQHRAPITHHPEVNRGGEVGQRAEGLALLLRVVPLVHDGVDGGLTARMGHHVALLVVGHGEVVYLFGGAIDGVGNRPTAALKRRHTVVLLRPGAVDAGLQREPFRRIDVHAHLPRIAVVPLTLLRAFVRQVAQRAVGVHLVRAAAHGQGVLVREGRLRNEVGPVGVRHPRRVPAAASPALLDVVPRAMCVLRRVKELLVVRHRWCVGVGKLLGVLVVGRPATELNHVGSAHRGRTVHNVRHRQRAGVVDAHPPALSLFGRHENHAVGTTRTVDGRGRGVLQDVDGLNVAGVQGLKRRTKRTGDIGDIGDKKRSA